jgi:hypothetical protein
VGVFAALVVVGAAAGVAYYLNLHEDAQVVWESFWYP